MRILGEGRTLGVHTVITADRGNAVPSAVAANISRRVVLRMGDDSQYMLLSVPRDVLDEHSAPGRAIVDGHEAQIAVLGGTMNVVEQTKALRTFRRPAACRRRARPARDRGPADRGAGGRPARAGGGCRCSAWPTTPWRREGSSPSARSSWPARRPRDL